MGNLWKTNIIVLGIVAVIGAITGSGYYLLNQMSTELDEWQSL